MAKNIWVVLEHRDGKIKKTSLETVAVAKSVASTFGGKVAALVLGDATEAMAPEAGAWGADEVIRFEDASLARYNANSYADAIAALAAKEEPAAILATATTNGKDLAGRLAARLDAGLAADCVGLRADGDGLLTAVRPMYAGKIHATVTFREPRTQVVTIRPKVIEAAPVAVSATVRIADVKPAAGCLMTTVKEFVARASSRPELMDADIIVSGGRGVKSTEGFRVLEELADVLGAAVGASRSAVDSGFRGHEDQVGQTGKVVNPKLYFACGISGAIQHWVGMQNARYIVAINKDPEAPIFKKADYGIVGDLFEVVPALTAEFKKALA